MLGKQVVRGNQFAQYKIWLGSPKKNANVIPIFCEYLILDSVGFKRTIKMWHYNVYVNNTYYKTCYVIPNIGTYGNLMNVQAIIRSTYVQTVQYHTYTYITVDRKTWIHLDELWMHMICKQYVCFTKWTLNDELSCLFQKPCDIYELLFVWVLKLEAVTGKSLDQTETPFVLEL